jgi:sulfur-oxidizing protein SoxX
VRRLVLALPFAFLATAAASGDRAPVAYTVVDGAAIPEPLTETPGDAARGAEIAADPARGGCLACHDGEASLDGAGARQPSGRLRLMVVNYAILDPDVGKPAFYDIPEPAGLDDAAPPPETRLTAAEVEDVVAWLATLTE